MKLITGMDEIRAAQTVDFPTHYDVVNWYPQYTKGYVHAFYDHSKQKWIHGYSATREEALDYCETMKKLCAQMPGFYNWLELSEFYIYSSFGHSKATWALLGCVVDE